MAPGVVLSWNLWDLVTTLRMGTIWVEKGSRSMESFWMEETERVDRDGVSWVFFFFLLAHFVVTLSRGVFDDLSFWKPGLHNLILHVGMYWRIADTPWRMWPVFLFIVYLFAKESLDGVKCKMWACVCVSVLASSLQPGRLFFFFLARWRFSLGPRAEELGPAPQMLYLPSGFSKNCKWPYFMVCFPYTASVDHIFSLSWRCSSWCSTNFVCLGWYLPWQLVLGWRLFELKNVNCW